MQYSNGLKEPHGTNIRRWTPKLTVSSIFKREGAVSIRSYTVIHGIVGVQISAFPYPQKY